MAKIDLKSSAIVAIPVTAAVYIVSWLMGFFNLGQITELFASVPATSVISGTVGEKVFGFIGGIVPLGEFGAMPILTVYVSALIALIVGRFLIDQFKLPVFKNFFGFNGNAGRIASTILYGAIPVYLVLVGTAIPSVMSVVGVLIHTVLVSLVAVFLAGLMKMKI